MKLSINYDIATLHM